MSTVAQALETLKAEFGGGAEAAAEDVRQFVIFHVGGERFAVALVGGAGDHPAPRCGARAAEPASLEGLANLRGAVLPIVSLRRAFGFAEKPARRRHPRGGARSRAVPSGWWSTAWPMWSRSSVSASKPASAIRSALDAERA